MRNLNDNRHVVDSLFVLILFSIFAVCAILIIAFGANIYQRTVNNLDEHFNITTSVAYIQEKFRQSDSSDAFSLAKFGDGDALCISSDINDTIYHTYIYKEDGFLKELNVKDGSQVSSQAGQSLLKVKAFSITDTGNGSYMFIITDDKGNTRQISCCSRCDI